MHHEHEKKFWFKCYPRFINTLENLLTTENATQFILVFLCFRLPCHNYGALVPQGLLFHLVEFSDVCLFSFLFVAPCILDPIKKWNERYNFFWFVKSWAPHLLYSTCSFVEFLKLYTLLQCKIASKYRAFVSWFIFDSFYRLSNLAATADWQAYPYRCKQIEPSFLANGSQLQVSGSIVTNSGQFLVVDACEPRMH